MSPALFVAALGSLCAHWWFYLRYDVPDIIFFYLPSWALWAYVGSIGAGEIWNIIARWRIRWRVHILFVYAWLLYGMTIMQAIMAYPVANMRGNSIAREMSEDIPKSVPQNAMLLVMSDDLLFALWVLQRVEGKRMDVQLVSYPSDESYAVQLIRSTIEKRIPEGKVHVTFVSPAMRRWFLHPSGWVAQVSLEPPGRIVKDVTHPLNVTQALVDVKPVAMLRIKLHRHRTRPEMFIAVTTTWFIRNASEANDWRVLWLVRLRNTDISEPPIKGAGAEDRPFWWAELHRIIPQGIAVSDNQVLVVDYCLGVNIDILPGKYELLTAIVPSKVVKNVNLTDGKQVKKLWKWFRQVGALEIFLR
ncbi:MAG TPA: hypothetical protein EYP10_10035 [Armatimonadetes bacterium]|nr:hypothetical protein [Armatimonadota bacterium]